MLIIDEINRANLAKVFGELYFLLEYRNHNISLTYSEDGKSDFSLPENLFLIGTMNTADRSIALVDAAMRRRFAFLELHPTTPPVAGMLHRWLVKQELDPRPARLQDALDALIEDRDFRIGPSYLMRPEVHRPGGLDRVWRTSILPLLVEHHYGEGVDVEQVYGLEPDLVWYRGDRPSAVLDAKYKRHKGKSAPNADLFQMLAYCTVLGLDRGHLLYAGGHGARAHTVRGSGIEIRQHALDLELPPAELLEQVDAVAAQLIG